jgi:hypothetical protein
MDAPEMRHRIAMKPCNLPGNQGIREKHDLPKTSSTPASRERISRAGNRIGRKMTINGARGFHPRIKDRFDLTVECIRRHYRKEDSPLSDTLARYADFFALFGDFRGYVEFFLLQDLVTEDFSAVKFFTPFDDFIPWPLPQTTEAYRAYKQHALDFIGARNRRILASTG